jgi:Flp pilus assembly pilin Flp
MSFLPREEGQGLVEYILILGFVAIALIIVVTLFGQEIAQAFSKVADAF